MAYFKQKKSNGDVNAESAVTKEKAVSLASPFKANQEVNDFRKLKRNSKRNEPFSGEDHRVNDDTYCTTSNGIMHLDVLYDNGVTEQCVELDRIRILSERTRDETERVWQTRNTLLFYSS